MGRGRRRLVNGLVVFGSLLAFLSVFAIWVERQALNTDDWVQTSDRLIQNKEIRSSLSDYLVDQLYANVDLEKELEEKLPGETSDLAGPISGLVRNVAPDGVNRVLETSTAQDLWQDANRTAHEQLVAVLEDKQEAVSTDGGEVKLELGTLVQELADQVGVGGSLADKLDPDAAEITILQSDELKTAQNVTVALKGLAIILSLLTFIVFGIAIYLSRDERWVTVLFCGIGLVAAGFAVLVAREIAGGIVVEELVKQDNVKPAADAAWGISTSLMVSLAKTVIVVGVLFGIAGWLASPTRAAAAVRKAITPVLRDYPAYVYAGLAILVGFYFFTASVQNLRSFLTTLVVAGLAAFGIHELRRQSTEENPDVSYDEFVGRTKEKFKGAVKSANIGERASKIRLPEVRMPGREGEDAGATGAGAAGGAAAGATGAAEAPTAVLPQDSRLERLERLGKLQESGVLTKEEFEAEKARILNADD